MNRTIAIAAIGLVLATPALARTASPEKIISIYMDLDNMCRGGAGEGTDDACAVRTKVGYLLDDYGWCLVKKGQDRSQIAWHKCTKNSYHYGEEIQ